MDVGIANNQQPVFYVQSTNPLVAFVESICSGSQSYTGITINRKNQTMKKEKRSGLVPIVMGVS